MGARIADWEDAFIDFMTQEAVEQKRTLPEHQEDFEAALWFSLDKQKWKSFSRLCRRLRKLPDFMHYVESEEDTVGHDDYFWDFLEYLPNAAVKDPENRLCIFLAIAQALTDFSCP